MGFEVAEEIGQTALALGPAEEVQVAGHKAPGKYYQLLVLLAVAQRLYNGQLLVEPGKNIDPPNGGEGYKVGCVHIPSPIPIGHGSGFFQSYCFFSWPA